MQIILKLTTACNLRCVYCSEGDQQEERMPEVLFRKLVDDLPELLSELGVKEAEFLFHGGEPLLYGKEEMEHLVCYAREHLPDYNLRFLMQTNGSLIDDAWIQFFRENGISVGISFDGYPEIHDKNRRTKSDEPTAAHVLHNIQKMRKAGLSCGTLMVVNSTDNLDADKLFDFIRDYGLQPKIQPVVPCGRALGRNDARQIAESYAGLMKHLFTRALAENMHRGIQPLDEMMDAILGIAPVRECSYNGSCGRNFICLYPDGNAGFCGRDNFARQLVYGSLYQSSLRTLYHSANAERIRARQTYLEKHDCKDCVEWELCHGGCAFEAMNSFGMVETKYANCAMRKELAHFLRTDGITLLKEALVREKTSRRKLIKVQRQMLKEVDAWKPDEVTVLGGN